jgi:glycosyltransferase involved in cell wall biosynthesis
MNLSTSVIDENTPVEAYETPWVAAETPGEVTGERGYPAVAITSDHWQPDRHQSGVVAYTTNLVEGLMRLGATVKVMATNVGARDAEGLVWPVPHWNEIRGRGVTRAWAAFNRRWRPDYTQSWIMARRVLWLLRELHQQAGVELLETEESCGVAGLIVPASPVPVVVRLHGPWFLVGPAAGAMMDRRFGRRVRCEGQAFIKAAGVSAPSRDVLRRTEEHYQIHLKRSAVIPNPVTPVVETERWRYERCDPNRLLFVGRFDRAKGADILIDAFARVLARRPTARVTIVGADTGVVDDGGTRTHAAEYIARALPETWMASRVELLGLQTPAQILAIRRACFACIVASRYESFSMVTLEAMAAGCPVIAPNVGGVPEIIRHERNGLLFKPANATDLADMILRLMQSPAMARALGEQGARDAVMDYDPVGVAGRTLEFYRQVIEDR